MIDFYHQKIPETFSLRHVGRMETETYQTHRKESEKWAGLPHQRLLMRRLSGEPGSVPGPTATSWCLLFQRFFITDSEAIKVRKLSCIITGSRYTVRN